MSLEVYQIVVPVLVLVSFAFTCRQYLKGNYTLFEVILWSSFWFFIAAIALFPDPIANFFSQTFGIKDHINAIIFVGLGFLFYMQLRMFNTVKEQNRTITELIRKIAIEQKDEA